jgi:hypothetical protein
VSSESARHRHRTTLGMTHVESSGGTRPRGGVHESGWGSLTLCGIVAVWFALSATGCLAVVSLDPMIGPGEAIAVPKLLGDWISYDEYGDSSLARVTPGADSTSYIVELDEPTAFGPVSFGRPTMSLRVAPSGQRLLAEAIPSDDDAMVDSVGWRYGALVQLTYVAVVLELVGDDVWVSALDRDSVRAVMRAGRCPPPGGVMHRTGDQPADLILWGTPHEMRRTNECLIGVPGVLTQPAVYRRVAPVAPR